MTERGCDREWEPEKAELRLARRSQPTSHGSGARRRPARPQQAPAAERLPASSIRRLQSLHDLPHIRYVLQMSCIWAGDVCNVPSRRAGGAAQLVRQLPQFGDSLNQQTLRSCWHASLNARP